jgi:hypothetical protein
VDGIELRVEGDASQMNVSEALASLTAMARLLSEWEPDSPIWRPRHASISSLALTVAPASPDAGIIERAYSEARRVGDGLRYLAKHASIPAGWSPRKARLLRKAGAHMQAGSGITGLSITIDPAEPIYITPVMLENANAAVKVRLLSYGSAVGKLDIVNLRSRKPKIQLLDQQTGDDVKCEFSPELLDQAMSLVGKVVAVEGLLKRDTEARKVSIEVTGLSQVERQIQPPISELIGILGPDWTGGVDSVEWIRQQRD